MNGNLQISRRCVFSVDVEDWFHILDVPSSPAVSDWTKLRSCVERNFHALLDLLDVREVKATCFFLGWVAERFPHLVAEAAGRGHEIASHGYSHQLVFRMTEQEFREDIQKAKAILEDKAARAVRGYRSPGFSCTDEVPWFFEQIRSVGYHYDSSVFPATRGHGGMPGARLAPYLAQTQAGQLAEFPISVASLLRRRFCFFGGGYLRLSPYFLVRRMAHRVLAEDRPVIFYVHPREIDPAQPRLAMPALRRFKCYVNLKSTGAKIRSILRDFEFITFSQFLDQSPLFKKAL
jgi:polysaccharide deacetylase family protein (PEP-CTERM system associated)